MISRFWKKFRVRDHKLEFCLLLLLIPVVFAAIFFFASTQHLRIEARTASAEVEISPGRPIAWAMDRALLLECSQLARIAARSRERTTKVPQEQIADGAEIELAAIEADGGKRLSTVRARVSLHGDGVVVELVAKTKLDGKATENAPGCSEDTSRVAVLDTGDGKRRGVRLPAQFHLKGASIGNGLTLEFRGDLLIGNDLTGGRQPLLTSGRLTFREVRSSWAQTFADAQFDIESRDLGLGDKVTINAKSGGDSSENASQGFLHIVRGQGSPEMSVYATAAASHTVIVRPFSLPEKPKANWFRRLLADEMIGKLAAILAFMVSAISLYFGYLQLKASARE